MADHKQKLYDFLGPSGDPYFSVVVGVGFDDFDSTLGAFWPLHLLRVLRTDAAGQHQLF